MGRRGIPVVHRYPIIYHKMDIQERFALIDSLKEYLRNNNMISFAYLFGSFKDYDETVGFRDLDIAVYLTGVTDVLRQKGKGDR